MDDEQKARARVNARIQKALPRSGWKSTVALVVVNKPNVFLLGTGTLFAVGGIGFVVTAAHTVKGPHSHGKTIGLTDATESFVSVHGDWIVSAADESNGGEDFLDVAVYRLSPEQVAKLAGKSFLGLDDIDFGEQTGTSVFSLLGYPNIWSSPSHFDNEPLIVRPMEYTTYAFDGQTKDLLGYNRSVHLLMGHDDSTVTQLDGSKMQFIRRDGTLASMPREFKGISGCGVWIVGDLSKPLDRWDETPPRLVAVETGVYHESQVLRATRWIAVTTLISLAFPELRSNLEL